MLISPSIPFPPISWWMAALQEQQILIDLGEYYQKMSYRNRYYLAGPQGKQLMSIPLEAGRNQHKPMTDVRIDYKDNWQSRHWKTMVSLYGRSPFFEYFEYKIRPLYQEEKFPFLQEWNEASLSLSADLLDWNPDISTTTEYHRHYPGENDIRDKCSPLKLQGQTPQYYQVFQERTGFIPGCSVLDILFCEGKRAAILLRDS